ncbi:MAG: SAM-dependent methyltransferase [Desulfuromonadales bacterium]|nr:SAM-dependent methyltransferase [Desulfuromonadales bacterium]
MNHVWFVGAGPGDPDLLTRKGERLLRECVTVFAAEPFAVTFTELVAGKEILSPFAYYFDELIGVVEERLVTGSVVFLIPGDLTFYAPFQGLIERLGERAVVVPGVGIVNAASALLRKTLDLPGICNRVIVTSPRTLGDHHQAPSLSELAAPGVTLLIYMNNRPLSALTAELKTGYGQNVPIALLHRVGLPGEEVISGTLDDIVPLVGDRENVLFNLGDPTGRPALTLVIVGETLAARPDGTWWDYRREHIWRQREGEQ